VRERAAGDVAGSRLRRPDWGNDWRAQIVEHGVEADEIEAFLVPAEDCTSPARRVGGTLFERTNRRVASPPYLSVLRLGVKKGPRLAVVGHPGGMGQRPASRQGRHGHGESAAGSSSRTG
jgi:hypothetical protein